MKDCGGFSFLLSFPQTTELRLDPSPWVCVRSHKAWTETTRHGDRRVEAARRAGAHGRRGLPHLLFTGFKGCGKTTIGRKVARRLGLEFVDLDNVIEDLYAERNPARLSFRGIFQAIGREAFRRLELEAARRVAERAARRVAERAARRVAERAARRAADPESGAGSATASGAGSAGASGGRAAAAAGAGSAGASDAPPAPGAAPAAGTGGLLIALGGGALMNPDTRQVLRGIGRIVYLKTSMKEILRRARVRGFPAFIKGENPEAEFVRIFQEREPVYLESADVAVDIGTAGPEDAAELVIAAIRQDG